jgi:hypothetical protein
MADPVLEEHIERLRRLTRQVSQLRGLSTAMTGDVERARDAADDDVRAHDSSSDETPKPTRRLPPRRAHRRHRSGA